MNKIIYFTFMVYFIFYQSQLVTSSFYFLIKLLKFKMKKIYTWKVIICRVSSNSIIPSGIEDFYSTNMLPENTLVYDLIKL